MDKKSDGFTLVEVIVMAAILGLIVAISAPRLSEFKRIVEERVCDANRKTVEQHYNDLLIVNEHDDSSFIKFHIENFDIVCPAVGEISYKDGKVKCSVHKGKSDIDEDPLEGEVPWL
ncbi:MAG: type II secretion system protein [Anaerovoracaceae bacterium]|jgi:competence protein ComGC